MRKLIAGLVGTVLVLSGAGQAKGVAVYSNDFEGTAGPEWSSTSTSTTPTGARGFLGEFGRETVGLTLGGLPDHSAVSIGFDLFIIRSWDGNNVGNPGSEYGPDVFRVAVTGGPELLATTFGVFGAPTDFQAFPDAYPGGSHPSNAGAAEVNSLGYMYASAPHDAVYHLEFTTPHTGSSLEVSFTGAMVDGPLDKANESWGIDNVVVSVTPIPEPGTLVMLLGVLLGIACYRKRLKK